MTLDNFENYIPTKIQMRGEAYYIDDAIKYLEEIAPGEWEATVEGSEVYTIEVSINENEITNWQCDCPYEGEICKHVVAVLLSIRKQLKDKKISGFVATEATVVVDEALVINTIAKQHTETEIKALLAFVETEALTSFLCTYATTHPEFKEALQQQFTPLKNSENLVTNYCLEIKECFNSATRSSSYHRYSRYEEIDLDDISSNLDVYLKKAAFLLKQGSFGDVASIALQILRLIGENYDTDQYYAMYDDWFPLEDDCATAGTLLLDLARNAEAPQPLKETILSELSEIAQLEAYCNYCVYDIEVLVDNIRYTCLSPEESLKWVNQLISKERKDSSRMYDLVKQRIKLLQEMGREKEAEATIEKYIDQPEIRGIRLTQLLEAKCYKEALACADEGIFTAKKENQPGVVSQWMKEKLTIYQQTNQENYIIATAKELFIWQRGNMEYYHLLKKHVAREAWKPFLKSLLSQTKLTKGLFLRSHIEADIFVAEGDEEQLMALLRSTPSANQLEWLSSYAQHLKKRYSAELIDLYTQQIKSYAQRNIGRNHYEYVARKLMEMKEIEGGKKAIDALVTFFRATYKNRRAMMEILNKGF